MEKRSVTIVGQIAYVELTHKQEAIIDAEDALLISQFNWFANPWRYGWYAMRRQWLTGKGRSKPVLMHRVILNAPSASLIDHINGDGLDNRKSNLRLATASQNNANKKISSNNTSGYKGVHFDNQKYKWRAMINTDGKRRHLGYFATEEAAHFAYSQEAKKLFGEFARAK